MSGHNHQLNSAGYEILPAANSTSSIYSAISQSLDSLKPKTSFATSEQDLTRSASEKPLNISNISTSILEISPFERNLTYKCQSCSKRTNCLEKMETHIFVQTRPWPHPLQRPKHFRLLAIPSTIRTFRQQMMQIRNELLDTHTHKKLNI